jgi:hypothetical protein
MLSRRRLLVCAVTRGVLGGIAIVVGGLSLSPTRAESQASARRAGEELVREALSHEIAAQDRERQRLLDRALQVAPDYSPAHWQKGEIRIGTQWRPIDKALETEQQQQLRQLYEERRGQTTDTAEGQLALADWCAKHQLTAQETAHLNRVLQLAPDQPVARQRLQFARVGNKWVQRQDLWQGLQQPRERADSLRKWQKKLRELVASLRRSSAEQTAARLRRLQDEMTRDAIPAVEIGLGSESETAALAGVELLGSLQSHEASSALTRLAVLSPWPTVRAAAARQLSTRSRDQYVPMLLAELSMPIESQAQTAVVNGQLVYRHEFIRETHERRERAVADTVMLGAQTANPWNPNDPGGRARALADAQATAYAREWARLRQNQQIESVNNRICEALGAATTQSLPADPQAWWSWWNAENEVSLTGDKPDEVAYRQDVRTYYPGGPGGYGGPARSGGGSGPPPGRNECFVAGTLVWTVAGPRAIEGIQVGDLVLSQELDTGELAYQPVLQTTRRTPEPLVKVHLVTRSAETLEGSGGHPLWVAGEGWVNLRQLKSGMVLHRIDGSTVISEVEETEAQPTYNLVVDRFHTYVVGEARVLCHDNTPRRPTNALVPGLTAR